MAFPRKQFKPLNRKRFPARRYHSLKTRKGLMDALDEVTSYIVRKRDGRCVLCGTTEDLTASHFFSRRWLHIRWNLQNVCCMCERCNFNHNVNVWPYANWMLDTYDEGIMSELYDLRMQTRKIENDELKSLLEQYKCKLRGMN